MSELTDLMAVYGAVDEAVVRDPDRRARVAELGPIYAEGGGGWYDDFRKWAMEKGADDPPFPPLDEALELHERLRAPALLARTRVDWGESLIASGDIPRGRSLLEQGRDAASALGCEGIRRRATEALQRVPV